MSDLKECPHKGCKITTLHGHGTDLQYLPRGETAYEDILTPMEGVFVKQPIPVHARKWNGDLASMRTWVKECVATRGEADIVQGAHLFLKRRTTGMTETLWQNISDPDWGQDITAAVFDILHETWVGVKDGQWIMFGTKGEFYPCDSNEEGTAPMNYERVRG